MAAQKVILDLYNTPFYEWVGRRASFYNKEKEQVDDSFNYIILYVLGEIESDIWRKAFWAYVKKFSLPGIKLNEVRDFEILDKDDVMGLLTHPMLGHLGLTGWVGAFKTFEMKSELAEYLRSFRVTEITKNNIEVFLENQASLTNSQIIRIKTLLNSIKNKYFLSEYSEYISKIEKASGER